MCLACTIKSQISIHGLPRKYPQALKCTKDESFYNLICTQNIQAEKTFKHQKGIDLIVLFMNKICFNFHLCFVFGQIQTLSHIFFLRIDFLIEK